MKVLITGASGFVGREVSIALFKAGHSLVFIKGHFNGGSCSLLIASSPNYSVFSGRLGKEGDSRDICPSNGSDSKNL